jgi:hypothetical protein
MRTAVTLCSRTALLAGPAALAFFSGGYHDEPRLVAGIVAWALVAAAALLAPRPLPAGRAGRIALAGLAALTAWTALSLLWAPLAGPAFHDTQRVVLYLGALVAAAALLGDRGAARALEPALVAGIVLVVGYGLSGRLLPGLIDLTRTASSLGRLEQPLTYWNAMGALGAIGLVLAARIAGDPTRGAALRSAAAAAAVPLGLGVYLTFSRGALAAIGVGLVVLLAAAPTWSQLRAVAITVEGGAVAALVSTGLHGVSLSGSQSTREAQGAVMLAVLVVVMVAGAALQAWGSRLEREGRLRDHRLPLPARSSRLAVGAVVVAIGLALAAGAAGERRPALTQGGPARLESVESNRYEYWRVALDTFAAHPLRGVGSSGFAVEWLRKRPFPDPAHDAHSLYIETAAELGVVGLAALALMLGGVAACARSALRRQPVLVAGWCAGAATWALHAGIDWDWEMPALTLVAVLLAGALIAAAEPGPRRP